MIKYRQGADHTMKTCCCCKTNEVGSSGVMCTNCWYWINEKMTMEDIVVIISHISHRDPDNKYAKEIVNYIIADNYTYGKSKLGKND